MSEFNKVFDSALETVRAKERLNVAASTADMMLEALRYESSDKLAALEQIKQWLMRGATDKPVLDAPILARSHTRFRMYELSYLQGEWWIGRAFRTGFVSNRKLRSIKADAVALEYLRHISLQSIADGVARLVVEKGYNRPSFD